MTALPGQRAAQRPFRAMSSAQRAIGRAAASGSAGLGTTGVAFIDGQTYEVDLSAPEEEQLRRFEPEPAVDEAEPGPDSSSETSESDTQERQG